MATTTLQPTGVSGIPYSFAAKAAVAPGPYLLIDGQIAVPGIVFGQIAVPGVKDGQIAVPGVKFGQVTSH